MKVCEAGINARTTNNIDMGMENMMLILALASGVRYGELVGLRYNDIDFKNNRISIRVQWMYKDGGGFGDLKNDQSERTHFQLIA